MDFNESTLWMDFRAFVQERNCRIAPDAAKEIRALIAHGVAELNRSEYPLYMIEDAKRRLLLFANEMIKLAKRQHTQLLTADIFQTVKEDLCPVRPYC